MYTTKQEKGTNFLLTESGEFFVCVKERISYNSVYLT